MTPIEKADAARQLLENQAFKMVMSDLRSSLVEKLETVGFQDKDQQHEIALMLQLLKRIHSQLNGYIQEARIVEQRAKDDAFIERTRQTYRA